MAFRDTLFANISTAVTGTSVSISAELPFDSAGEPLYNKNMKFVYLGEDQISKEVFITTLDDADVSQTETSVTGFLSVDAKNPLTDIETVVASIINSRNSVADQITRDCEMTTSIDADVLTYEFNFNFITV